MLNDTTKKSHRAVVTWGLRAAAIIALVALVFVEREYKSHPQLLEHQLGNTGLALLMLGFGSLLLWQSVTGVRSSVIKGNYVSTQYKRTDNAFMFWFVVTFDAAGGAFVLFVGVGHFFGMW